MEKITAQAFEVQDPAKFVPNGDRYLVEEIEVENVKMVGDVKILLSGTDSLEQSRGWKLARVIAVGNGHRLETPDHAFADMDEQGNVTTTKVWATVPMFFKVGDLVFIERLTGRELTLQHRKYLIVNQIDVLGRAPDLATA